MAVILDIPVIRQVIGFVYVFFLPGLLILKIAKFNLHTIVETLLLAVGLSISFTMFLGLLLNELLPLLGYMQPLSILPVLVAMCVVLFAISFFGRNSVGWSCQFPEITKKKLAALAPLSIVFVTAVSGAVLTTSWILMLMLGAIGILVAVGIFGRKYLPTEFYPVAVLIFAISLVLHRELISSNLLGWDVFGEFYVFNLSHLSGLWNPTLALPIPQLLDYNSMLSVTVLPTILFDITNIQPEWIFKIAYFLIYIFVPLAIYEAYRKDFGRSIAFLSAFYFAFFPRFFMEERRQIIGELFFVLLVFTILSKTLTPKSKKILLVVFALSLVVSHYSISYIAIFCLGFSWIVLFVLQKPVFRHRVRAKVASAKRMIDAKFVVLISLFAAIWYTFFSVSLNKTFTSFVQHVIYASTTGFTSLDSRGGTVSEFVAPTLNTLTFVYKIDYIINKVPYILIGFGLLALILNRKKLKIQPEYIPMALGVFGLLIMALTFPFFAQAFIANRFFHVSLILLAPVSIYGGYQFLRFVQKRLLRRKKLLVKASYVLVILFLVIFAFKVGFVDQATGQTGTDTSMSLNYKAMQSSTDPVTLGAFYNPQVAPQEVASAQWLASFTAKNVTLYSDDTASKHVLPAYAGRLVNYDCIFANGISIRPDSYVYLRTLNVLGYMENDQGIGSNMTDIQNQLGHASLIYSNGNSQVYYMPPDG